MGDSTKTGGRALNPWVLHLQKLALELKCPLCLNLLNRPMLLPCDHIFCSSCISRSTQFELECPLCKSRCSNADSRHLHFLGNIVTIFKGLESISCANLQSVSSVLWRTPDQFPSQTDNSSSGQSASACKLVQGFTKRSVGDDKSKGLVMPFRGDSEVNNTNSNVLKPGFQVQARGSRECGAAQINMNQVEQLPLESPPSFGDTKGSDNEISEQDNDHVPKSYLTNISSKRKNDDWTRQENLICPPSGNEDHARASKRPKEINYELEDTGMYKADHTGSTVLQSESIVTSSMESGSKSGLATAAGALPAVINDSCAIGSVCGFCQTSKTTEVTGPMLHFANGKQVEGDEADHPNVIHVHSRCIDWAPQVYYIGETVKNLKQELARGAKLKCSRCGLKGAALGCYAKSCRRSYHLPCAMEISKCRWNYENFLMLCPSHSSFKFPNEKSGKKNHTAPMDITFLPSNAWAASSNKAKELIFCGSALSSEEKFHLVRFGKMIGATVSKFWNPSVTHVVAATDEKGAYTRTLKVLMAITHGKWVLKTDWVKASMEAMRPIEEEPYEVSLDNHGCMNGPKTGRLAALEKAPKLFDGLSFYFSGDFVSGFKEDLQSLVISAGGLVYENREQLLAHKGTSAGIYIVYNLDSPLGSQLGEEVTMLWHRLNEAEDLANRCGSQVIGHTWLLESIAAHKLQPLISS